MKLKSAGTFQGSIRGWPTFCDLSWTVSKLIVKHKILPSDMHSKLMHLEYFLLLIPKILDIFVTVHIYIHIHGTDIFARCRMRCAAIVTLLNKIIDSTFPLCYPLIG